MKLIIAGSRDISLSISELETFLCKVPAKPDEIVSGCCKGVDKSAINYANHHGIPLKEFPANWDIFGRGAGPIRNVEMAEYADALLLIWDGKSRGSLNMKKTMDNKGKPVYSHIIPPCHRRLCKEHE